MATEPYETTTFKGVPYILCQNSRLESKFSHGFECRRWVNISANTEVIAKLCKRCTSILSGWPQSVATESKVHRPRGWVKMKLFVDSEGNVFERGVERPELKGTMQPTPIKEKVKSLAVKKSKKDKTSERDALFYDLADSKRKLANLDESDFVNRMKLEARILDIEKRL